MASGLAGATNGATFKLSDFNADLADVISTILDTCVQKIPPPSKLGKITGWGLLGNPANPEKIFKIFAFYPTPLAGAQGTVEVQDHVAKLDIKSTWIDAVTTDMMAKTGTITGRATVNGVSDYPFEVYVEDKGDPGKGVDVFQISLPTYVPPYLNRGVLSFGDIKVIK